MSSKPPECRGSGGQKVIRIRPAVPLIYEPHLRDGGAKVSLQDTSVARDSLKEVSSGKQPVEEVVTEFRHAVEPSLERHECKTHNEQSPPNRDEPSDNSKQTVSLPEQENGELEQASSNSQSQLPHDLQVMVREAEQRKAASPTEEPPNERFEGSEISNTGTTLPESSRGGRFEDLTSSTTPGNCSSQTTQSQYSAIKDEVSQEISDVPMSFAEFAAEATSNVVPAIPSINYSAQYHQLPVYDNGNLQAPMYSNYWDLPHYDTHAQFPFAQAWNIGSQVNRLGGQPPPTPSSASMEDGSTNLDPKFLGHIASNFNVEKFADMRLVVIHERGRFDETTFFLHRILVSRSETIRGLLEEYGNNYDDYEDNKIVVKMKLNDRFITPIAIQYALRTCYGQPALNFLSSKSRGRAENHPNQSVAEMLEILAFTATGHFLKLEDVALRGLEKAREVLDWETLEYALAFGMESSIHRRESPEATLLQSFAYATPDGDLFSVDSAKSLLDHSLNFILASLPDSWTFDRSARPLPIVNRLPATGEPPNPRCVKSKLASIQFGQRPPEVNLKLMDRDALVSSIVLSVPLAQLRLLAVEKLSSIYSQLPQIVEERERRRLAALHSDVHWNQRRLAKGTEWYAVGFQEFYKNVDGNGGAPSLLSAPVSIYSNEIDEEEAKKRDEASRGMVQNPQGSES